MGKRQSVFPRNSLRTPATYEVKMAGIYCNREAVGGRNQFSKRRFFRTGSTYHVRGNPVGESELFTGSDREWQSPEEANNKRFLPFMISWADIIEKYALMIAGGGILFVILWKDATTAATGRRAWILTKYYVPCCATAQRGGAGYGSDNVDDFHGSAWNWPLHSLGGANDFL